MPCDCPAHGLAASRNLLTSDDVDELHRLALGMPIYAPGGPSRAEVNVLDIGAGSGTSALAIFHANPAAHVFTLDTNINALHSAEQAVRNVGARHRWTPVYLLDTDPQWPAWLRDVRFDLALVDGDHSASGVRLDWDNILRLHPIPQSVWWHDYNPPPSEWGENAEWEGYGVRQFVDAWAASGELAIMGTPGLGVTTWNDLRALFGMSAPPPVRDPDGPPIKASVRARLPAPSGKKGHGVRNA